MAGEVAVDSIVPTVNCGTHLALASLGDARGSQRVLIKLNLVFTEKSSQINFGQAKSLYITLCRNRINYICINQFIES